MDREFQQGFSGGGPLRRNRLFQFAALEYLHSRATLDPVTVGLPTAGYIAALPSGSLAKTLLDSYTPPVVSGSGAERAGNP